MNKIRTLIVDDEKPARDELSALLSAFDHIELVGQAANADQAEELIRRLDPQLIFLDVQMPERTGFDLLESLTSVPSVIFVTAYDTYALKAFEVSAVDYLMKPIREERLRKAIDLLKVRGPGVEQRLFVKDSGRYHLIKLVDIHLVESMDNYARIFFNKQVVLHKTSLNQLEQKLPGDVFFRTSRSQIINRNYIDKIDNNESGLFVKLLSGELVFVSTRQAPKLRQLLSK
ncbi:LytR/AlgR family response regulator transcription factor [Pedobacter sp. GR22-10]|uniref:LytR/AlgR family response regulator transcription factor n=1 Tax=Pedobacter sp. GR22-10 TaxID=2994472 RepID=UPI0022475452|nr:LytTR family DNA-binding domain-containing protein [Pedobacter sp. GR22-10]MCX2431648.1 LytTR family DNA-binding domain-containing protein [Pedobacter sp. GR22-10]